MNGADGLFGCDRVAFLNSYREVSKHSSRIQANVSCMAGESSTDRHHVANEFHCSVANSSVGIKNEGNQFRVVEVGNVLIFLDFILLYGRDGFPAVGIVPFGVYVGERL